MSARTQNVSQLVKIKPIPCQRQHKMHLNMCRPYPSLPGGTQKASQHVSPNSSHASDDTKCLSSCVDQIPFHASEVRKCISTCFHQTHTMPARTQNIPQHVFKKPIACQRGQKCILTCLDRTHPMSAGTQNACQQVFAKPIPYQRGHN
jgi:hypothetical protein